MKFLRARGFWSVVLLGAATFAVVGASRWYWVSARPQQSYRRCGHRPELKARLLVLFPYWQSIKRTENLASYVTIHGCSGDRARRALESLVYTQRAFQERFGRPANSLSELGTSGFRIDYENSQDGWCAYIPKQADLPGHYLATSNGVYFCEARRPTTNDYPLTFFK
jgi:hypothetical protein